MPKSSPSIELPSGAAFLAERHWLRLCFTLPAALVIWCLILICIGYFLGASSRKLMESGPIAAGLYFAPGGPTVGTSARPAGSGPDRAAPLNQAAVMPPLRHSVATGAEAVAPNATSSRRRLRVRLRKRAPVPAEIVPAPHAVVAVAAPKPATSVPAAAAPAGSGGALAVIASHAGSAAPQGAARGGVSGGGTGGGGADALTVVDHPPLLIARVVPEYPPDARARGIEGEVVLRAIVDPSGHVENDVEIVRSEPPFDKYAIAALRQWRFEPGRDGANRPVRVLIEVPMAFKLR